MYVYIIDDSNCATIYSIPDNVTVKPNVALLNSLSNTLLGSNRSSLINSLKNSSLQSTAFYVSSLVTMLDNQASVTNNVTNEQTDINKSIKEALIDVITSMKISDLNSITIILNTLSCLSKHKWK